MKILSLRFKNINSFRGEHAVNFTEKPLANAGLFAITGPTGSGKTTLLDVIALALYNRVPRIDERISRNFIERSGSVLTRNTKSAYAEVEYHTHSGRFLSRWWIETARTGKLKDYEMEVHDLNSGQVVDVKKSEVPAQNEKLIGLSYDQFMRSMLLAQGEFAKFLKASKDERGRLLEKITGSWIYREIGRRVYETQNEYKKKVDKYINQQEHLQNQLEAAEPLEDLRKQKAEAQKRVEASEQKVNLLKERAATKERFEQLTSQRDEKLKQQQALQQETEAFIGEKGNLLERHEALLPWQEELTQWQVNGKQLLELTNKREAWTIAMNKAKEAYTHAHSEITRFTNTQEKWPDEQGEQLLNEKQAAVETQLEKLEAAHFKYRELSASVLGPLKAIGYSFDARQPMGAINFLNKKSAEVADEIGNLQKDLSEKAFNEPADALELVEETLVKGQKGVLLAHEIKSREKQLQAYTGELSEQRSLAEKLEHSLAIASKDYQLAQKERENCEVLLQKERLQASLEHHRKQLHEGNPCPLCGSLTHPWAEDTPPVATDLEGQLKEAQKQEKRKRDEEQKVNTELLSLKKLHEQRTKEAQQLQQELESMNQEHLQLQASLPIDYREVQPEDLTETKKRLQRLLELRQQLEMCTETLPVLEQMLQVKKNGETVRQELEKLYPPAKDHAADVKQVFQTDLRRVAKNWQNALHQLHTLYERDSEWQKEHQRAQDEQQQLKQKLHKPLGTLGYTSVDEACRHLLSGENYQQLQRRRNELQQRKTEIDSALQNLQQYLNELNEAADWPDARVLRKELEQQQGSLQQHRSQLEKLSSKCYEIEGWQKQLKELDAKIASEREQSSVWRMLNEYIGDAQGKKFSTFAQQLTMKQLIALANKRLKTLSERYRLDMPDTDTEDDSIVVLDFDMGGMRRSVKTLSGGESFLVSLSLALGLSDLASQDVRINSLFIDEGFGTLDPQTLDQTLDTLEKLQAESNKTIGIISHVEALKERIATQIVMQRNGQGYSKLHVVSA